MHRQSVNHEGRICRKGLCIRTIHPVQARGAVSCEVGQPLIRPLVRSFAEEDQFRDHHAASSV